MTLENDQYCIDALNFSKSIKNLDERTAMNIALILASTDPERFSLYLKVAKQQNAVPISTLKLTPVPKIPVEKA